MEQNSEPIGLIYYNILIFEFQHHFSINNANKMCSLNLLTPCHKSKLPKNSLTPCHEIILPLCFSKYILSIGLRMNTIRSPKRPRTFSVRPNSLFPQILEVGPPSPNHNRSNLSASLSTSNPSTSSAPSLDRPPAQNARKRSAAEMSRERDRDSVCTMCSDSVKTRRHHHFSSSSIRRLIMSQSKEKDKNYKCPVCKSLESCMIPPSETRRIVLADSSLYGVWNKTLPKNTLHFDIDCIVGGRVQDLTTALMKNYLHMPNRVEIIVVGGINNIGAGDSAEQISRFMDVMKQVVQEHSTKWRHEPPSYVSFCTVMLAPKFCSLHIPSNPERPEVGMWVPPHNFQNKYSEVKKLNDMIIRKNKEGGRELKLVRLDYHGVKCFPSGTVQHRFDNVAGVAPVWREQDVFKKLHFTMEYKVKIISFISKCFRGNSSDPDVSVAEPSGHD